MSEVLVFKTNASPEVDQKLVAKQLRVLKGIKAWNFDLEDCDRIFRVVTDCISAEEIIHALQFVGIESEELTD